METTPPTRLALPRTQAGWALAYCYLTALFAVQGVVLMVLYAMQGFDTPPDAMPLGLRLDPLHSLIHLISGLLGTAIALWRPSAAVRFVQVFSLFYLTLAVLGTFAPDHLHLGMQLELAENALHWPLGLLAAAIGFGPWLVASMRRR
jgi:uncharacterized protein DUF4383